MNAHDDSASAGIFNGSRRHFMKTIGTLGAGAALAAADGTTAFAAEPANTPANARGEIPKRRLGRASAEISILGIGGHHLGDFEGVDRLQAAGPRGRVQQRDPQNVRARR